MALGRQRPLGRHEEQAGVDVPRAAAVLSVTPMAIRVPGEAQANPNLSPRAPALPHTLTLLPSVAGLMFPALPGPTCIFLESVLLNPGGSVIWACGSCCP